MAGIVAPPATCIQPVVRQPHLQHGYAPEYITSTCTTDVDNNIESLRTNAPSCNVRDFSGPAPPPNVSPASEFLPIRDEIPASATR